MTTDWQFAQRDPSEEFAKLHLCAMQKRQGASAFCFQWLYDPCTMVLAVESRTNFALQPGYPLTEFCATILFAEFANVRRSKTS